MPDAMLRDSPRMFPEVHHVRPGDFVTMSDASSLVYRGGGVWEAVPTAAAAFVEAAKASLPKPPEAP